MGFPQITDRVKTAPTQALRSVFAGIGRILLAADRPPEPTTTAARQADAARQRPRNRRSAGPSQVAESRWRSLDQTGNVRLLSADDLDDGFVAEPAGPEPAQTRAAQTRAAQTSEPDDALPLAHYDSLSLPSIRARLRSLDAEQLRVLAGHERSHAERQDVLGMLERRIEKLEASG